MQGRLGGGRVLDPAGHLEQRGRVREAAEVQARGPGRCWPSIPAVPLGAWGSDPVQSGPEKTVFLVSTLSPQGDPWRLASLALSQAARRAWKC